MKAILTAVIAMLVSVGTAQTVVSNNVLTKRICYVKKDAKGSNNGENWQDALTELSTALDFAKAHQKEFTEKEPLQIWVAGSANYSYSPKVGDGITADKATFAMVKNVKIYGGFAGNETALLQRNWYANPTVLSGRVNNAEVAHIGRLITSEGAMGVATLDGFRLKYAAAPINGKKGVAIYVANGSPRFENCAITDNLFGSEALIYVKGTERERATPIFINLQVSDNTPKKEDIIGDNVDDNIDQPNNGADGLVMTPWAMENDQYANTQLINATFYNNGGNDLKVAPSASPKIYNTVLLERVDGNFKNIDVQYSMVNGALSGNGNIQVESPAVIFVSLSKDDKYYLRPKRSLIDAGNGGLYHSKSDNDFDLAHMPRIMEGGIDIGAYEFYKDYESICNEIPRPNIEPNYYGNSCDGGGVNVRLSNYTDYHKINERGATYKVYDIEGKEVRPYMEPLIEFYSDGRIHINQEGRFKLVVSYKSCEKESDWFQIYYSRGAGKPNSPSLKTYPATCDSNSWVEIQKYESKYRYELLKDNRVINIIKNKDLVGLQEGSYELKVYNDSGCDKSSSFRIEGREKLDAPIVEPLPAECGKKGKGYITQFEQKWTYQLLLNGKVLRKLNSAEFTADAGSYQVVVRNANGCVATSATFVIEEAKKIPQKPDVWVDAPACGVSGKAIIKNYDRNLTYKLSNGATTKKLTSAEINEAGEYTLLVYNGSCDSEEVHFTVAAAKEGAVAPVVRTTSATCGEIGKAYIEGYDSNLRYRLVALSATGAVVKSSDINGAAIAVAAGSYKVEVRNADGCVATSATFVIEEAKKIPEKPVLSFKKPACGVSGKAIIEGYDRNLTYKLYNGTVTEKLTSAEINEAGKYTLLVNNGSCDSEEVQFVVEPAKEGAVTPKVTTTSATCGEIGKAYIDNYNAKLTYQLVALSATGAAVKSSAINTANLSMTAGTYQVVVRNANGCVATSTTFVIEEAKKIPALPKIDFITEAGCGIANDIRIRDYDKNFSYTLISKSGVRKSINSLHIEATEGTYQLEISNGDCAVTTSEFHIGKEKVLPAKPELRVLPATCGGVTDVLIKNYDNSLNYELSPAIAGNEILSNGVISATANNYVLIVSNGSCTSQSDPFEIKAQLLPPAVPTIEEEVAATCAAPSLVRISNYDPALQYKLSPAGEILQGGVISATVGRYIVIATNNNGCSANSSIFVINPQKEAPAQPKITVYNASCGTKGSAVIRNYRGDYTYSFTPEATITAGGVISATAGKYQLKVSNGTCEATAVSFEIEAERAIPAQPTVIVTAPDCGVAGSARISNYDPQLSYTVLPKIEGNVVLDNGVISVTAGGSYNVVVSNGYCKKSSEPFVVQRANEIPATPIVVTTSATCGEIGKAYIANYDRRYTDKYVLTPSGRVHYDGTIIADAGNYVLSVNNGSCKVSTAFTIEAEEAMPKAPAIVTTPATCGEAGSAKITNYDSNFTYTLLEGNKSTVLDNAVISVGEGVYRVSVTNAAGCQLISREFSIQAAKVISEKPVVITQAAICGEEGSAYVANYNPIYQYTVFPNGSVDANGNIKASKNIFTYVTAHYKGCSATSEGFTIQPKLNGVEQPEILLIPGGCGAVGFARITNFNPDYEYEVLPTGTITPDGRVMAPPTNTYYRVRAFHNGCAATSENFRLQPSTSGFEKPVLSVAKENCNMGTIAFVKNYNKEFTYTVHPFGGVTKDTGILVFPENSVTHTFSVTVTASNGVCQSTSDAVLIIPERSYQPRVAIVARTCDSEGAAYITNYNPAYRYVFTDPLLSVTDAGVILGAQPELVYAVAARTPDDCSSKETVFSIRNECENEVPCKIEIFNAVSANNDDANDFFYIKNIECYPSNKVYIFNSQGKVVFEQQNYDNSHRSFRGISNTEGAQLLPSGTYFYILKYADKRGRETDERGYLYLKGRY
ncbi:gliding motility-associated C-terminal domain-containing protein [uncultured Capnocytophaga sp.]|uniref:gliding motility-associated C-terminal domain-containing protein n=1 Tax=uncultured Capnocytophaga sp. TaxID=159273 RepID=UPI00259A6D53|nr:gliding motility-associated C-terminal domain-containing protein [uncultured Capnocytophaga sp.]